MTIKKLSLQCAEKIADRQEFVFDSSFKEEEKQRGIKRIRNLFIKMVQNPVGATLVQKLLKYRRRIYMADSSSNKSYAHCHPLYRIFWVYIARISSYHISATQPETFYCKSDDVSLFHELRHCLSAFDGIVAQRCRGRVKDDLFDNLEERAVIQDGTLSEQDYCKAANLLYRDDHGGSLASLSCLKESQYHRKSNLAYLLSKNAKQTLLEIYNTIGIGKLFEDMKYLLSYSISNNCCLIDFIHSNMNDKLKEALENKDNLKILFKFVRTQEDIFKLEQILEFIGESLHYHDNNDENILFYLNPLIPEYEKIVEYLIREKKLNIRNNKGQSFVFYNIFNFKINEIIPIRHLFYKDLGVLDLQEYQKYEYDRKVIQHNNCICRWGILFSISACVLAYYSLFIQPSSSSI